MKLPDLRHISLAIALSAVGAQSATAASFNFSGTFSQDSDVQFFTFTLNGPTSSLQISTSSFANANGFFPLIALWDSTGFNMGAPPGVTTGILNGTPSDVFWDYDLSHLGTGSQTFYLALFVNPNLPDVNSGDLLGGIPTSSIFHFNDQGVNEFTGATYCTNPSHPGSFYIPTATDCEQRTGAWALNISSDAATFASPWPVVGAVPEPATLSLALAGLAGFAPFARRRAS